MKRWLTAAVLAAVVAGIAARRVWPTRRLGGRLLFRPGRAGRVRWHVVTIYRPIADLGPLPEPVAELGDAVEVQLRPAPGQRGTEVAVRIRGGERDGVTPQAVRSALRRAEQLAETGQVLVPDRQPAAPGTPRTPLEFITRRAREEAPA